MVIELCFFKKKKKNKMENMAKMWKALFEILRISYITDQPPFWYTGYFSDILNFDIIKVGKNLCGRRCADFVALK